MRRVKTVIPVAGMLLLILAVASMCAALQSLSKLRPAEDYEDRGIHTFQPYNVLPVQVKNTGASGRDRRMNPTKTVYMVYYRATDGSGYKWSNEAYSRDHGQRVVEAGETVERRVLSIPEEGTYITVEPDETAGSYTEGVRGKFTRIVGLSTLYIFFYIGLQLILRIARRLRKKRAAKAGLDRFGASAASERFSPEITEVKPRRWGRNVLLVLLAVVLLVFVFWAVGHRSSNPVELDYGWSGDTWTCGELDLRFDLPVGGEIYDTELHQEERQRKFGFRGSAGQTLLAVMDRNEGSNLSLLVIRTDQPSEEFLLKMVTAYAKSTAGEGTYELESREELTVGGYSWQTWRIEMPEVGRVHYYLYRQSGEYALALTASGPMAETPPAILACFAGDSSVAAIPANTYLPAANEEGYYVFDVPPSLLGNKTPEELLEEWQTDLESAGPEDIERLGWTDLQAGEDGGVRYVCTAEQYQRMKQMYYSYGTQIFPPMFGIDPGEIIERIAYDRVDENGIPWAVNVWIDQTAFQSGGLFSDFIANFVPMTMIGRYQLMCGVPAGEWAVHVTVKDAGNGAIILEQDFSG